jgi:threonine synthase
MFYKSTRPSDEKLTASEAILKGIADNGGLFVSESFNKVDLNWDIIKNGSYEDVAFEVMKHYLSDFDSSTLKKCIHNAYSKSFKDHTPINVKKIGDSYFLELFHGPTAAFKDMALTILPHLLKSALDKHGVKEKALILTATSGDTGSAALYGFQNVEGVEIGVFYPQNGVSDIQKRQMVAVSAPNTYVCAIDGNFDQAQSEVKRLFEDKEFKSELANENRFLSSANSINIGRLVPQIVYYIYSYAELVRANEISWGDPINVSVPTGNFGNILAAYYAKLSGLPIKRLICASNSNNVLYDFFKTGHYDQNRPFYKTSSPSMDILLSSNLERLLYELLDGDRDVLADLMSALKSEKSYTLPQKSFERLCDFYGGFANDDMTSKEIKRVYEKYNYLIDPHTAVASKVYTDYVKETNDDTKTLIVSTASPYKFTPVVYSALFGDSDLNAFDLLKNLESKTGSSIPWSLKNISDLKPHHNASSSIEHMSSGLKAFVKEEL